MQYTMKRTVQKLTALVLVFVMLLALGLQAAAAWPATGVTSANNYLNPGILKGSGVPTKYTSIGGFARLYLVAEGSETSAYTMTPTSISFGDHNASKNNKADLVLNKAYDFSQPVQYNITAEDGRTAPVFALVVEGTNGVWTAAEKQEMLGLAELMANSFHDICVAANTITAEGEEIGSYHPANADMLMEFGYWLGMFTYFDPADGETTMNGNRLFDSYEDKWQAGGAEAVSFMEQYLTKWMERNKTWLFKPSAVKTIYEKIVPWYIHYALDTRIAEPGLEKVSIGGSVGTIDATNGIVTVLLPEGTDAEKLSVDVTPADGCKAKNVAGSLAQGSLAYTVTPYDKAFGTEYTALARTWKIQIQTGTPRNEVTSFGITVDGKTRWAAIDQLTKTIKLNLPVGTALTALMPVIEHTGTGTNMDGKTLDFSQEKTLTLTNSKFNLSTTYTVTVTANKSDENSILSYKLGGAAGKISGSTVSVEIPYAADLSKLTPAIEISEFAELNAPASLQVGKNTYTVTSESGKAKTWTVNITRAAVASGNQIVSFRYGSVEAVIDQALGTITMELPAGSSTSFAPVIVTSAYATVSPASGVKQNFAVPVQYTVTAQNGSTNTYTVTVKVETTAAENPHKAKMEALVEKVIARYRTSATDDWEYMNIGFYDQKLNNMDAKTIGKRIAKLDSTTNVAMTNLDRKIMTLTACGIDCSNLAKYNGGQPYVDSKGNKIDNLVEVLYNYSGSYTINGPIFALNALDMGNYTIPSNAVWTREKLLETILNHVYLSDGFGLDMVTMLMQSIAPYQDDPVYGARVKAKLEEGLEIVLKNFGSKNAFKNPYGVQWGGVYTSEGSAQIVCAMSAMGVDCHTDARMSNGTQSALTALLDYADYTAGYFAHDNTTPKNAMATYQGTYATQWYLGFLNNGGAGHGYSLYYRRFDFSRKLSTDANITMFTMDGKTGVFDVNEKGESTITLTLPAGTDLSAMTPHITLPVGATLLDPDLSKPVTFVGGVAKPFTVQAEDGKTKKTFYVTVKLSSDVKASGAELKTDTIKLTDANILRELEILSTDVTVTDKATQIELHVNAGVDTTALYLKADTSYKSTCTPAVDGKAKLDLTNWKTFTVTSEDKANTTTYQIKVTPRKVAAITSFKLTINGKSYSGAIDNTKNTITISGVDDSALTTTRFAPDIEVSGDTKVCTPASGIAQDFSKEVLYTVNGDGETTIARTYTVSVLNTSGKLISANAGGASDDPKPSVTGAKITSFKIYGVEGEIDHTAGTIVISLPNGTNVTKVCPQITTVSGCTVSPANNQVVNLTRPIQYTVTLGTETKTYTVSVKYVRSLSQQFWDEVADNNTVNGGHQVSKDPHPLTGGRP